MIDTVSVLMPNGTIRTADLGGLTGEGHRTASVRVVNSNGRQVRIAGRVTTRHGYMNRVLPFEVNMTSRNARSAFINATDTIFVKAA